MSSIRFKVGQNGLESEISYLVSKHNGFDYDKAVKNVEESKKEFITEKDKEHWSTNMNDNYKRKRKEFDIRD